jgi:GNAT superfamily N-acetyltransferase
MNHIALAITDAEIARCHDVMLQLRPHVPKDGFVARVRRMQQTGYHLAFLSDMDIVRAAAGFRVLDQLVSGRVLYVDDLVTDETVRSHGHGAALLRWLHDRARTEQCGYLELDSGVQRNGAHRFYFRHGLTITGYHFRSAALRDDSEQLP